MMKTTFSKIFSVLATVMLLLAAVPGGVAQAAGNANIPVIPASQSVGVGQIFSVDIKFDTTSQQVDSAQAWLFYSVADIQAVDASGNVVTGGQQSGHITPGNMTVA